MVAALVAKGSTEPDATLQIRVHMLYREPIPDTTVTITPLSISKGEQRLIQCATTVDDEANQATCEIDLSPGIYIVEISAAGQKSVLLDRVELVSDQILKLNIQLLSDKPIFRGRIIDTDGKPVDDFKINVFVKTDSSGFWVKSGYLHIIFDYGTNNIGSGYFQVWLPIQGEYYLEVISSGYAIKSLGTIQVTSDVDLGTIQMQQKEAIISGRIINEEGNPVTGMGVCAENPNAKSFLSGDIDENGNYQIRNLIPGKYSLEIFHCGSDIYRATTISSVSVSSGEKIKLDPIILKRKK